MFFFYFLLNLLSRSLSEVNPWIHLRQRAVLRLFQGFKSFQFQLPSRSSHDVVLWSSEAANRCEVKVVY